MQSILNGFQPRHRYLLFLIVAVLLAGYTTYKLSMMLQIRGWISGANIRRESVTQKHISQGRRGEAYWLSWTSDNIQNPGNHRLNVSYGQWKNITLGDQIEIVYTKGSDTPHTRDGIYASNGNLMFDGLLLLGEISVIIVMIIRLYKLRGQRSP